MDTLDIDSKVNPDILCDAKEMSKLPKGKYDAVYCSHNLEHFHKHEIPQVLSGFSHVLKSSGFANISVPDMNEVFEQIIKGNRDIDDIWYKSSMGQVSFHDVIYGLGSQVSTGNSYYCHKRGFTEKSLGKTLKAFFKKVLVASDGMGNLHAFAFKTTPSKELMMRLGC